MSSRRVESFLLRVVVHECPAAEAEQWRGRIQHVSSGFERHFDRLQDMITFITEHVADARSIVITCDEQITSE